jgi:hypothetical protein
MVFLRPNVAAEVMAQEEKNSQNEENPRRAAVHNVGSTRVQ